MIRLPAPFATIACLLASPALAAWAPLGNPLSNMPAFQYEPVAARYHFYAGPGAASGQGMVVVWTDTRSDGGDLYYSIVTDAPPADPAPGTDGTPLAVAPGSQNSSAIAAVFSPIVGLPVTVSPVVVAWTDWPPAQPMQVRARRVGDLDWPATGVPVHDAGPIWGKDAAVCPDGSTGAVVAWTEFTNALHATRVQRLDFTGARLWGANGVPLGSDTTVSSVPQTAVVPGGGAYVLRLDRRNGTLTGSARALALFRVDGSGALAAGWPAEGLLLGDATVLSHRLLPDGNGGAYVIWQQSETLSNDGAGHGVRMTRILANGSAAAGWTVAGTPVAVRADGHVRLGSADVRPDGGVVLALTYEQVVGGPSATGVDLIAQRMLPDGQRAPGWPAVGRDLCVAPGAQQGVKVIASGEGLLAVWSDERGGVDGADLYGVKLAGDGALALDWVANGNLLCGAPSEQSDVVLEPATGGGAVFAWKDQRDFGDTQTDVYAQTVNAIGQVDVQEAAPGRLSLSAPLPQPASATAQFRLAGLSGEASIEVLDLQGRTVAAWSERVAAGGSSIRWDLAGRDGRRVAPGVYHLSVRLGSFAASRRIVVVH